jgi:hypothetical protein
MQRGHYLRHSHPKTRRVTGVHTEILEMFEAESHQFRLSTSPLWHRMLRTIEQGLVAELKTKSK